MPFVDRNGHRYTIIDFYTALRGRNKSSRSENTFCAPANESKQRSEQTAK